MPRRFRITKCKWKKEKACARCKRIILEGYRVTWYTDDGSISYPVCCLKHAMDLIARLELEEKVKDLVYPFPDVHEIYVYSIVKALKRVGYRDEEFLTPSQSRTLGVGYWDIHVHPLRTIERPEILIDVKEDDKGLTFHILLDYLDKNHREIIVNIVNEIRKLALDSRILLDPDFRHSTREDYEVLKPIFKSLKSEHCEIIGPYRWGIV